MNLEKKTTPKTTVEMIMNTPRKHRHTPKDSGLDSGWVEPTQQAGESEVGIRIRKELKAALKSLAKSTWS